MRWIVPLVFALTIGIHFWIASSPVADAPSGWASYDFDAQEPARVRIYMEAGSYWLGLSYATSMAFAAWCFLRVLRQRRQAVAGSAVGLTLSGVLLASVCFLTGCCGSPMLPIYLGLFGSQFLSITKPLTFVVTLLSILVGYAWMVKRSPIAEAN